MSSTDNGNSSALSFPCEFHIKIVGKADPAFEGAVMKIMHTHVPDLGEAAVKENYSKESKYVSMTVTIIAQSQQQLDQIYGDLSANEYVIMAL